MKTYEIYGAPLSSAVSTTLEEVERIASQVQERLGVELFVRPGRQPYSHYSAYGDEGDVARETFVLDNGHTAGELAPYPEFEHPVIVGIGEPSHPIESQAVLEAMGLELLRRRRRNYVTPPTRSGEPTLEMYGAPDDAASTVALLLPLLGMAFDGNEHAAAGADSHYYDESERFGTILVYDNVPRPFDDSPFPRYADFATVLISVNAPHGDELRDLLLSSGLTLLKTSGSEDET